MTNPASVINALGCVAFNAAYLYVKKKSYGINCDVTALETTIKTAQNYIDLLRVSNVVCSSLECKILGFIQDNPYDLCVRDTTQLNSR